MERFDDKLKYATGFVKPKTTSVFFEKILISDDLLDEEAAHFGYSYIPREVLLANSIEEYFHIKRKKSEVSGIGKLLAAGEMSHYIKDADIDKMWATHEVGHFLSDIKFTRHIARNSPIRDDDLDFFDIHIPRGASDLLNKMELDVDSEQVKYKYSSNRNKGIASVIERCAFYGFNIVPIYFSPTDYEKQFMNITDNSINTPAISICINNLPEIIEDKLDWEQVLSIRKDKDSITKIRRLKNWLNTEILHKDESEMKSILDKAVDDYSFALKKHGIQTMAGAISTVSTASITLLNAVSQNGSFNIAGISIASGLSVFAIKSFIDRIEAKRHPIALVYDLMK